MDHTAIAQQIAADHAAMYRYISLLAPPDDHRWYQEPGIEAIAADGGARHPEPCIVMRRVSGANAERIQLLIEIRLLWIHEGPLRVRPAKDLGYCYEAVVRAACGEQHDDALDTTERFQHDYISGLWGRVAMAVVGEIKQHKIRVY